MSDFLDALGLLLAIEGIVYCLFPGGVRRLAVRLQTTPDASLRLFGLLAAVSGVGVVFLVRG